MKTQKFIVAILGGAVLLASTNLQAQIKLASWVHGNNLVVEEPTGMYVKHIGRGTELNLVNPYFPNNYNKTTWCHIAIPTPVIVDNVRLKVQTIFLLYKAEQHAMINNIHIWDGPNRIATWDVREGSDYSARRTGNHCNGIDDQNVFTLPEPHEVIFGLSISFTYSAYARSGYGLDPLASLLITTAGADFF